LDKGRKRCSNEEEQTALTGRPSRLYTQGLSGKTGGRLGRVFNSGDELVDVLMGFGVWRWMVVSSGKVVADADMWL
jgi:hypothetical protein